jgi:hypothetical protein
MSFINNFVFRNADRQFFFARGSKKTAQIGYKSLTGLLDDGMVCKVDPSLSDTFT